MIHKGFLALDELAWNKLVSTGTMLLSACRNSSVTTYILNTLDTAFTPSVTATANVYMRLKRLGIRLASE